MSAAVVLTPVVPAHRCKPRPGCLDVIRAVEAVTSVPSATLRARNRNWRTNTARQAVMYISLVDLKRSASHVARVLGRCHSVVLRGRDAFAEHLEDDALVRIIHAEVLNRLGIASAASSNATQPVGGQAKTAESHARRGGPPFCA